MPGCDFGDGKGAGGFGIGILDGKGNSIIMFFRMRRGMAGCGIY